MTKNNSEPTPESRNPSRRRWAALLVLAVVVIGFGLIFFQVTRPLLLPLFMAAVAALMLHPWQEKLSTRLGGRDWLAALLLTLLLIVAILGPLGTAVAASWHELHEGLTTLNGENGSPKELLSPESNPQVAEGSRWLSASLQLNEEQVRGWLRDLGEKGEAVLYRRSAELAGDLPGLALAFALFLLAVFFFLKDGRAIMKTWDDLTPLDNAHDATLRREFATVCRGVVFGTFLAAVVQGVLFAIGLFLIDLGFGTGLGGWVMLLSLATVALAAIPFLGAIAVWLPVAVGLFINGHYAAAVVLAVFGAAVVSQIDTVIRVWVLKDTARMHPLFVFICVLGGVQLMGFVGVFVGPIVGAVLFALLRILKKELTKLTTQQAPSASEG